MNFIATGLSALRRLLGRPRTDRMTIPPDQTANMERKVQSDPVLANAFRLMHDASLLIDMHRYSSALALAVLSLEEIGKYLLAVWSAEDAKFTYNKHRLHQIKQAAIGALFMAEGARKEIRKRGINIRELSTPEDFAELTRAVMAGMEQSSWFARYAKGKGIEYVKWSAIYYDTEMAAKGIEPSKIKRDDTVGIMELCSRAFMLLGDDANVAIAKYAFPTIYETELSDPAAL
jgi:AbiV family abortive infection protein